MNRYRYGHEDCEIIVPSFTISGGETENMLDG